MSAPARQDLRRGWCPSLFEPMESGDGLIVRLKPRAATIEAAAAGAGADAAARWGTRVQEESTREKHQLRGARPETVAPIAAMATRLQLAAADPTIERIRSVMASPLGPDDPGAAFDSHALAADIERMLAAEPGLAALPAKFGFLVDGGGALPLDGVSADIMLRPAENGVRVEIAGAEAAAECSLVEAASAVRRVALAFVALAGRAVHPPRRMRDLARAVGAAAVFAEAGLSAAAFHQAPRPAPRAIGFVAVPGSSRGAYGIGLPYGQIESAALTALADLAEHHGDGTLRTTPWRALLVVNVAEKDAVLLAARAEALGLITDPADPRRAIAACPGKPACASATVETRADAALLALRGAVAPLVHVSGCAKGCAHAGTAELTLVGANGLYNLVISGRAGDRPVASGLTLEDAVSAYALLRSGTPR
jgi:precorrin-3B synthase